MNIFGNTKSKTDHKSILGGMGFFDEADFEKESSSVVSTITQGVGGIVEDIFSLGQDIAGVEPKKETKGAGKFPSTGSFKFNQPEASSENKKQEEQFKKWQKEKAESDRKKAFFQTLKEQQEKVKREQDRVFEEELNDIVSNLPTEQKNRLLHYQASYKDRSIYQRAELRKKLIEEQQKAAKQEKAAAIPSPAKQPSAMEGAFEGRSGNQGSGQANLSAQAVG